MHAVRRGQLGRAGVQVVRGGHGQRRRRLHRQILHARHGRRRRGRLLRLLRDRRRVQRQRERHLHRQGRVRLGEAHLHRLRGLVVAAVPVLCPLVRHDEQQTRRDGRQQHHQLLHQRQVVHAARVVRKRGVPPAVGEVGVVVRHERPGSAVRLAHLLQRDEATTGEVLLRLGLQEGNGGMGGRREEEREQHVVLGGLRTHGEEVEAFGKRVVAGGDGVNIADHDEGAVAGVVGLHQHVREPLGPQRGAVLVQGADGVVVGVDEVGDVAHFCEMPHLVMRRRWSWHHFVAELERERVRGEVPKLDAAIAVAIHVLLHAHHAQFRERVGQLVMSHGRRNNLNGGVGNLGAEGGELSRHVVQGNERALLAAHEQQGRVL